MSLETKLESSIEVTASDQPTANGASTPDATESHLATSSTWDDVRHMSRLGRKQELVRNFRLLSTISFVAIATAGWELSLFTVNQGLIDGGRAGLIWSYVWNFIGFWPVILSMAEMASMAPISGSQFHWVSEFAPPRYQKQLSYITGWMSTLAWQAGNALGVFLCALLIQTIILVNNVNYAFPNWQGTLLVVAVTTVTALLNVYGARYIPGAQNFMFVLHCLLYLCFIIPVWALAPHATPSEVFLNFENLGGWSNLTLCIFAGQLSGISAMTGVDTAAHMAEEIRDADINIPRAMVGAYIINFVTSFVVVLTLCFGIPHLDRALNDPSTYPAVYVLRHTMSDGCITAFLAGVVLILFCSNVSYLAAVSRDLFAFARDRGLPFSGWMAKVDSRRHVPVNAVTTSAIFAMILSLIYLGSSTAFYALTSLFTVAILQCYLFSIGCILWRRVYRPGTLPPARWSLGRYGGATNACALIYVTWAFFWAFWPQVTPVDASSLNWASVVFGAIVIVSGLLYFFRIRHIYTGPVVLVEGRSNTKEESAS